MRYRVSNALILKLIFCNEIFLHILEKKKVETLLERKVQILKSAGEDLKVKIAEFGTLMVSFNWVMMVRTCNSVVHYD